MVFYWIIVVIIIKLIVFIYGVRIIVVVGFLKIMCSRCFRFFGVVIRWVFR